MLFNKIAEIKSESAYAVNIQISMQIQNGGKVVS